MKRRSRTYDCWANMIQRCTNKRRADAKHYVLRGITVCERWRTFENFLADMGEAPPGMELDRKHNDGNYEPGNCQWTTRSRQMFNCSRTVMVTIDGVTKPRLEWCKIYGISEFVVRRRVNGHGWTNERALTTPHMTRTQDEKGRIAWSTNTS